MGRLAAGPAAVADERSSWRSHPNLISCFCGWRAANSIPRSVLLLPAGNRGGCPIVEMPTVASICDHPRALLSLVKLPYCPHDRASSADNFYSLTHLRLAPLTRGERLPVHAGHNSATPEGEFARHHHDDAVRRHVAEHVCVPRGGCEPVLDQLSAQGRSQVLVRDTSRLETTVRVAC